MSVLGIPVPQVLENRNFRLFFIGQAVSAFGDQIVPVALAFGVLSITRSASALGLVLAAQTVPLVVFVLIGGVVADRLRRLSVMLGSDFLRAATQGAAAILLITGVATVWELVVLQTLYGTAEAFFGPAATGFMPEVVPSGQLQEANGLIGVSRNLTGVLGPAVAGILVVTIGAGLGLALDSATFLVSAIALASLRIETTRRATSASFLREIQEGWAEFRARTWVWLSVTHFGMWHLVCLSSFYVLGPIVARDSLDGASSWAVIVTANAVGAVLGAAAALRFRPKRPGAVLFASLGLCWGPQPLLLAIRPPIAVFALFGVLAGAAVAFGGALWVTLLQRFVPAESISRVSSYDWLGSYALMPAGLALVGLVAGTIGIQTTLIACFAWAIGSSLLVASLPSIRNLRLAPTAGESQATPIELAVAGSE
jgi:hypothetical protein